MASCITAPSDQTLLEAARDNGIKIPTLCHLDGVGDFGACRLCLVEIAGSSKLAAVLHDGRRRGNERAPRIRRGCRNIAR